MEKRMPKVLDDLLAEAAIRDVQFRYCRAADRRDFELYRTCFHDDAVLEFSFFTGGVDEFMEMARETLARFAVTTHFTGNHLIEITGDSAWCEFYTLATHRIDADEEGPRRDYVASIRYVDRMERRSGEWRIARRLCIVDWGRTDPVPERGDGPTAGTGLRDRHDPSYQLL
jgi:ketosteroid isomerase-like protein